MVHPPPLNNTRQSNHFSIAPNQVHPWHPIKRCAKKRSIFERAWDLATSVFKTIWGANSVTTPFEQTEFVYQRMRSVPGLWERLCAATEEGRPRCHRKIIEISAEAGIVAQNPEDQTEAENTFRIYSEHHESVSLMGLSPEEDDKFLTIIWALEGKTIKTQA